MTPTDILRAQPRDFIARFTQTLRDNADKQITGSLFEDRDTGLCMCAAGALILAGTTKGLAKARGGKFSWQLILDSLPTPPTVDPTTDANVLYEFIYSLNDSHKLTFNQIADLVEKLVDGPSTFGLSDDGISMITDGVSTLLWINHHRDYRVSEMGGQLLARAIAEAYREGKF